MKTAMQELIEELESIKGYKYGGLVIRLMKEKLEKEKEQICDSYVEGLEGLYMGAEEYYNKTFNQDRELGKEVTDLLENYKKTKNKL
jgi:hypothetical protein